MPRVTIGIDCIRMVPWEDAAGPRVQLAKLGRKPNREQSTTMKREPMTKPTNPTIHHLTYQVADITITLGALLIGFCIITGRGVGEEGMPEAPSQEDARDAG